MLNEDFLKNLKPFKVQAKNLKGKRVIFYLLKRKDVAVLSKKALAQELYEITEESWGAFDKDFMLKHTIDSDLLALAQADDKIIGYASLDEKELNGENFFYFEFLVIRKDYQKLGLSRYLINILMKRSFWKNLKKGIFHINYATITPNPRVVGIINRVSSWMYPNPGLFKKGKGIPEADNRVWKIAQAVIKKSNNPERKIDREGLVLHDSYADTPWLIYKPGEVPKDKDERVNEFCDYYLKFNKEKGDEFIVLAKIRVSQGILNLIKKVLK